MYFGLITTKGVEVRAPEYRRVYAGDFTFKLSPSENDSLVFVNMQNIIWPMCVGQWDIISAIGVFHEANSELPFYTKQLRANVQLTVGTCLIFVPGSLGIASNLNRSNHHA